MASEIETEEQFEQAMAEGRPIISEKGIGPAPKDGVVIDVDSAETDQIRPSNVRMGGASAETDQTWV